MTANRPPFSSRSPVAHPTRRKSVWNAPIDALCHRPTAQRQSCLSFVFIALLGILLFLCPGVEASDDYHGELIFDRSPPPVPPMQAMWKRDSSPAGIPSEIAAPSSTSRGSASSTASGIITATSGASHELPKVFDTSLGNNFTAPSCPKFFQSFLSDSDFQDCLPFSLLLQTSTSFFAATHSIVQLTRTLDATCRVDFTTCSTLMSSLATRISKDENCGADLRMQNPTVQQAYDGLIAYEPLYQAGCLLDSQGNYCFANAITNASAPTSSYVYYLPLGVELPAGTRPTCNKCLQDTMDVFASAAGNSSQPLNDDFNDAAEMIDIACGPTFVEASVTQSSASSLLATGTSSGLVLGLGAVVSTFLLLV